MKNSVGDGFRGASISIGKRSYNSENAARAYQTQLWHRNSRLLLPEFNLRSLTFEYPEEKVVDEHEDLQPGQYTFRDEILKGKDPLKSLTEKIVYQEDVETINIWWYVTSIEESYNLFQEIFSKLRCLIWMVRSKKPLSLKNST